MRRGMMTALNFRRIRTRTKTLQKCPSKSAYAMLRQLCGVNTSFSTLPLSLKWGHKNEKKVLRFFEKVVRKIHRHFQFNSTGLCLRKENVLIKCFSDGVCFCKCPKDKNWPCRRLKEIKYFNIHRYSWAKLLLKKTVATPTALIMHGNFQPRISTIPRCKNCWVL